MSTRLGLRVRTGAIATLCLWACSGPRSTSQTPDAGRTDRADLGLPATDAGEVDGAHDAESDAGVPGDVALVDSNPGDAPSDGDTLTSDADSAEGSDAAVDGAPDDPAVDSATDDAAGDSPPEIEVPWVLFDLEAIRDRSTARCTFTNRRTEVRGLALFDVWDVSLVSFELVDGALVPITLRGFAAKPQSASGRLAGIVNVHGLGGFSTASMALGPAEVVGAITIAMTGPGGGDPEVAASISEGHGPGADGHRRLFDTVPDPRGTWLWSHAVGAMRALTCLEAREDVDPGRLGMTGFSGGGIATLISASVDDRLAAAVPISGTGGWRTSAAAPQSWFHALLTEAGLSTASPEWDALTSNIDPVALLAGSRVPILMVNGTTDEFFPVASHVETFNAIPADTPHRTSLVANLDHGCFALTGGEARATIEERAAEHADGALRLWFHHWFGDDATYASLPETPQVLVQDLLGWTAVAVVVDPGAGYTVESVRFWWSNDDAVTFLGDDLDGSGTTWSKLPTLIPYSASAISFVDVEYRTSGLFGERFWLSSPPVIPVGHVPAPRGITSCLP